MELNKVLRANQGKKKVALVFVNNLGEGKRMVLPFGINYTAQLAEEIKRIIKNEN